MKRQFEEHLPYVQLIEDALSRVDEEYFFVKTTYGKIVRERVFCYELYHHMRKLQTKTPPPRITINGEVDKSGHKDFDLKEQKNPDFVFHIQGTHDGNTVIVEVKGSLYRRKWDTTQKKIISTSVNRKGIKKDFETILTFISNHEYQLGVFILYNHSQEEFLQEMLSELKELAEHDKADQVFILTRKKDDTRAEQFGLSDVRSQSVRSSR